MLLGVLDNRDSFTFNLVHLLEPYVSEVRVRRCDDPRALADLRDVDALVLSPGPGLPRESGALMDVIADHFGRTPILGVCLGMQALAEFTGGRLVHTGTPRHGIARPITWSEPFAFGTELPSPMKVGWYHSWAVDAQSLGPDWTVTATDHDGLPAALRHAKAAVWAVQFHPESVLSPSGPSLLAAWAASSRQARGGAAPSAR
ncbi:MAG: anthranilate synthase component II [Bacteroidota bacterium]